MTLVTPDNFPALLDWMSWHNTLAVDTETNGLQPFHGNRIVGVSIADAEQGWYVPFGHGEGFNFGPVERKALRQAIENTHGVVMFNGTFDLNFLRARWGMRPRKPGSFEEVQVAAHLHNENDFNKYYARPAGLKELADKYLGPGSSLDEAALRERVAMRFGKGKANTKAWKGLMWHLPATLVESYASADAVLTFRLRDYFRSKFDPKMMALYYEMCDYTLLLQEMTMRGIQVDNALCENLYYQTAVDAEKAAADFRTLAGLPDFNLNSAPQLHRLFNQDSVRADLLQEWAAAEANDHQYATAEEGEAVHRRKELATALLLFRAADKMHGSYFAKYLPLLDRDNRLHPNFNVTGTETGRLSCSNPNLQAIPRDVAKHQVKRLFIPSKREGWLVEMDYSQAEIRLASFYGREYLMAEHLRLGKDIHSETAALIGCDRSTAKRINFSAIYGIGPKKYSVTYGVPFEESERNLRAYHETYPGFRNLYGMAEKYATTNLQLTLPSGRIRHYHLPKGQLVEPHDLLQVRIMNANLQIETHKASSNLVQGMVAALMMKAMLRLWRELPEMKMVLTVHDSLLFDMEPIDGQFAIEERNNIIAEAQHIMEDPAPDDPAFRFRGVLGYPDCPMKVDVKVTQQSWGEATEWGVNRF